MKGHILYCSGTAKRRIKEAVIKSAARAASLGFAGERPVTRRSHAGPSSWRSPANQAALAAVLITASFTPLLVVPGQSKSKEKGFATSQTCQKRRQKVALLGRYASKSPNFDRKFNSKAWRRLRDWSRTLEVSKKMKNSSFGSAGTVA